MNEYTPFHIFANICISFTGLHKYFIRFGFRCLRSFNGEEQQLTFGENGGQLINRMLYLFIS